MTVEPKRICGKFKMASCQGDCSIMFDTHILTHTAVLIVPVSFFYQGARKPMYLHAIIKTGVKTSALPFITPTLWIHMVMIFLFVCDMLYFEEHRICIDRKFYSHVWS